MQSSDVKGLLALVGTTVLWASSFPAIKIVMSTLDAYTYTWLRSLIAALSLLPYIVYSYFKGRMSVEAVKGGLFVGVAYALGLWLQGWGTKYTTASNSAFITGLNVVFVHLYVSLVEHRYSLNLLLSLVFSVTGLYLLSSPQAAVSIGDLLVLIGAVAWAAQILLLSKYSKYDPVVITFFEMMPALSFIVPSTFYLKNTHVSLAILLLVVYLALVCGNGAFVLQAFGQRFVAPEIASLIFLLEPVFASLFSYIVLNETLTLLQILGAGLIIAGMITAEISGLKKKVD